MILFVAFMAFGFFYYVGYFAAMIKFDSKKPKLTAVQIRGEFSDFTDLQGRVDVDKFSEHLASLLDPKNYFKRENEQVTK